MPTHPTAAAPGSGGAPADLAKHAVELFSGIGGWHAALASLRDAGPSELDLRVGRAFDVNTVANDVYRENFGLQPSTVTVERLRPEQLRAAVWFLSPPCQPHTRSGKGLDDQDARSGALAHLVELLPRVRPEVVLLENVPEFAESRSCAGLRSGLLALGRTVHEFQLDAAWFGTPNERRRYFLVARQEAGAGAPRALSYRHIPGGRYFEPGGQPRAVEVPIGAFLTGPAGAVPAALVPSSKLLRPGFRHDIVGAASTRCSTFTKGYGRHTLGGPLLDVADASGGDSERFRPYEPGQKLRLFSCEEMLRFPDGVTEPQRRRLIGNALNVEVARELIRFALEVRED